MTILPEEWDQMQAGWTTANDRLQNLLRADHLDDDAIVQADKAAWEIEKRLLNIPAPHQRALLWKAQRIVQDEIDWAPSITLPFLDDCQRLLAA